MERFKCETDKLKGYWCGLAGSPDVPNQFKLCRSMEMRGNSQNKQRMNWRKNFEAVQSEGLILLAYIALLSVLGPDIYYIVEEVSFWSFCLYFIIFF